MRKLVKTKYPPFDAKPKKITEDVARLNYSEVPTTVDKMIEFLTSVKLSNPVTLDLSFFFGDDYYDDSFVRIGFERDETADEIAVRRAEYDIAKDRYRKLETMTVKRMAKEDRALMKRLRAVSADGPDGMTIDITPAAMREEFK